MERTKGIFHFFLLLFYLGNRHIINTDSIWFREMAVLLSVVFGPQGENGQLAADYSQYKCFNLHGTL